jgi:photosystem II stability/assembly factor-like uncharacterized protein
MHSTRLSAIALVLACAALSLGQAEKKKEEPKAMFASLSWRSIGPANMGGRVADICLAPGSSRQFYVAFGTSGLWKTTSEGTTFTPVLDHEQTSSFGSVVVCDAPDNWSGWKDDPDMSATDRKEKAKGKIVWAGSGEGNGRNSSSWGVGIYRSTDGGTSFKNVGLEQASDIPRIAVDPRNPDVCYAAALGRLWGPNKERGIYKTTDGGKTWHPSLQIDENTGAIDVILDPSNPETVYAAMYMRRRTPYSFMSGGPHGGIYKSTDGGKNWHKLTKGLPAQTGRIGLDIYAKNGNEIFALIESDISGVRNLDDDRSRSGGLFKSTDGGESWTRMHERVPRAFYFTKVRVDPTDDKRVYILGFGLDYSDDGGKTFHKGLADHVHGDCHALVIDPNNHDHLLLGDDGGLFQSYDRGKTWQYDNNMAVGEFYSVAYDMSDPYRVFGGLQDNGSWMGPSTSQFLVPGNEPNTVMGITNADWKFISDSDGFHCAFDPEDPDILYSEGQGADLYRSNLRTGQFKSISIIPKEGQPRIRFNWNSPLIYSKHEPKTLYVGGNYVFKLLNRGDEFERISPDLTKHDYATIETTGSNAETYGTVVSLVESPLKQGLLWSGSDDGMIYVTEGDGKNWRDVTPKAADGRYVSKLEASNHDPSVAYATIDGHRSNQNDPLVLMTRDMGRSWKNITGDLPKAWTAMAIREDMTNPNVIYLGTQSAMFFTYDQGNHWIKLNGTSLPTVPVYDIQQHPRERDLILATHGRSIYILDNAMPLSQMSEAVANSALYFFDPKPATPRNYLFSGIPGDQWFKAKNPPIGGYLDYWVKEGAEDNVTILIEDSAGTKIRDLTGPARAGLNRVLWDLQPNDDMKLATTQEPGGPFFVAPGDYKVTITHGKERASKTIKVNAAKV